MVFLAVILLFFECYFFVLAVITQPPPYERPQHFHFGITAKTLYCAPVFLALFILGKTPPKKRPEKNKKTTTKRFSQRDFHKEISTDSFSQRDFHAEISGAKKRFQDW